MSIIDEIKEARKQLVNEEQKTKILLQVKQQLTTREYAIIDGASHYRNQTWILEDHYIRAPFKCHAAISAWLQELGFKTSRYYNQGGVDNGLKIWI